LAAAAVVAVPHLHLFLAALLLFLLGVWGCGRGRHFEIVLRRV
jgi:hypothetical protein